MFLQISLLQTKKPRKDKGKPVTNKGLGKKDPKAKRRKIPKVKPSANEASDEMSEKKNGKKDKKYNDQPFKLSVSWCSTLVSGMWI